MTEARIEAEHWLSDVYARCDRLTEVWRDPASGDQTDKNRQTQVEDGEAVRVLGYFGDRGDQALIMKWDRALGWVSRNSLTIDESIESLSPPALTRQSPSEFFEAWRGTRYLWGGITRAGVDCSGFTQRYFLQVLGQEIPRNSRDQRRAGTPRRLEEISDHDLVFCRRREGGAHHVGVYFDGKVWHAGQEHGVVGLALGEFQSRYRIEEVISCKR